MATGRFNAQRTLETSCYPTNVSKIRLSSTTSLPLQFFEFHALSNGTDVASGKPATQSSTYNNNNYKFGAGNAVDGKVSTFSHTGAWDVNAAWTVDLGGQFEIMSIDILNRYCGDASDPSDCLCRLSDATVELLDSANSTLHTYQFQDTCGVFNPVLDLNSCDVSHPFFN